MLKRLILSLALAAGLISPAFAAGTIPGISMTQQLDSLGTPLNGGKLYLIQAGTTSTPQNCYQDSGLTIAWPNPITLDSAGRIPQLFCADGSIKIRLINAAGVQQLVQDGLLIVGPSGGGGGGGSVDPTTIFQTGQLIYMYGTGVLSGFVRANGRTIGSSTSGATERANADCQSLFQYLWGADANLAVSGGRGASAAADWAANKTITLPDLRGRALAGLDDMGNSPAGRLTATYFGTTATILGAAGGAQNFAMTLANLIQHTHPNTLTDPGHFHQEKAAGGGIVSSNIVFAQGDNGNSGSNQSTVAAVTGITINNASVGSASPTPMTTVQPTMLATIYLKL